MEKIIPKIAKKISEKNYKMTIGNEIPFRKISFSFTKIHSLFKMDFIDNITQEEITFKNNLHLNNKIDNW